MTKLASPLFLDDLFVGMEFQSAEHPLDTEQIFGFARQFDPQPFHLDPMAAENSLFQGLAASGWHTAAISMKLLVGSLPLAGGLIGAGVEVRWPRPTRPDDVLRVVTKVLSITPSRSKPDRGMVAVESDTLNQRGDIRQHMTARLVVPRNTG